MRVVCFCFGFCDVDGRVEDVRDGRWRCGQVFWAALSKWSDSVGLGRLFGDWHFTTRDNTTNDEAIITTTITIITVVVELHLYMVGSPSLTTTSIGGLDQRATGAICRPGRSRLLPHHNHQELGTGIN